jgi:hypothetical protein
VVATTLAVVSLCFLLVSSAATGRSSAGSVALDAARPAVLPAPVDTSKLKPGEILSLTNDVASLRTRTSRTFVTTAGSYLVVATGASLNYQDAAGAWRPVDSSLVGVTGGVENKANAFQVHLPVNLADPVRVSKVTDSASFQLIGADGIGAVAGAADTFTGVLPSVDVRYESLADGLKESLVLQSAAAASTFTFRLGTSTGLAPRQAGNAIEFVTTDGKTVFSFAPPFMTDAAGAYSPAVSMTLAGSAGAYSVVVTAD